MKVATNTVVSLRYSMKNERGDLLEDIMNREPVDYLHGSGNILPALEANLEGLECGAQRSISVSFETNPDRKDSFHFVHDHFGTHSPSYSYAGGGKAFAYSIYINRIRFHLGPERYRVVMQDITISKLPVHLIV